MPVVPVVQVNPCGDLTGIPLPINIAHEVIAYATDVEPWAFVNFLTHAIWAVQDRYILWIQLTLSYLEQQASRFREHPMDSVYLLTTIGAAGHRHVPRNPFAFYENSGRYEHIFFKWVPPYPLPVVAGVGLALRLYNRCDSVIDSISGYIYYLPVG